MRTVPDVKLPDVKPYTGNPHVLAYVVIAILGFYCMASTMLYLNYVRPDYRALLCLTRCEHETEVLEFFGRDPEIVYFKGDKMPPPGAGSCRPAPFPTRSWSIQTEVRCGFMCMLMDMDRLNMCIRPIPSDIWVCRQMKLEFS